MSQLPMKTNSRFKCVNNGHESTEKFEEREVVFFFFTNLVSFYGIMHPALGALGNEPEH